MVVLKDLNQVLKAFDGANLTGNDKKELTVKTVLVTQLGGYAGQKVSGDNLIKAYDLGLKLYNAENDVELDGEQLRFIKTVVSESPMYLAIVMGQVLKYLDNAKDTDKKGSEDKQKID